MINGTCNGCHGAGHPTGLDLSSKAAAYTSLVGKAAGAGGGTSCTGTTRVVASNALGSLLWLKINHTANCGSNMPLGGAKLSADKIDLVAAWINAGAQDN